VVSFNNCIILHSVISGAWNLNYFMTQGSMMSLSQCFQEASCCGVKKRNKSWKQSHGNLWSVSLKIVLLWWKNLEIWSCAATWSVEPGHTEAVIEDTLWPLAKAHLIGPFTSFPPFFSPVCSIIPCENTRKKILPNILLHFKTGAGAWTFRCGEISRESHVTLRSSFKYLFCL